MSEINVFHLVNTFADSSISRIILRLMGNMSMEGVGWHIGGLSGEGPMKDEFVRIGVHVADFSENGSKRIRQSLRQYMLSNAIKIIHTHTPRTIFAALSATTGSNISHLSTKHLLTRSGDRKWGAVYALLDRSSLYIPDRLIPVSQKMYQQIINQPGIKSERVTMIRNAIPIEHFFVPEERDACRRELGLSPTTIVLGYMGRIQKVKRIDILLEAFALVSGIYSNTHLVVAGDGDAKQRLESYANGLGLSNRLTWTGFRKDIPRILAAMDIYIQTSLNEGLSLSILEAMAAGKPIIATDVGGNSEAITNGVTGLLLQNGSVDEIAKAIIFMIENPESRNRFSLEGLNLVRHSFSLDKMVDGYQNLYQEVIAKKNL